MSDYRDNMAIGGECESEGLSKHSAVGGRPVVGHEASTTAKIDLVVGMRVRKRAKKWPIYRICDMEQRIVICEWAQGHRSCCGDLEELQQLAADGKLLVVDEGDGSESLQ